MELFIKTGQELQSLRESGRRLSQALAQVIEAAQPGVSTLELDALAEHLIRAAGGTPVFKGYDAGGGRPFPGTVCSSLNAEVVHGIPRAACVLKRGDILKLDIGMRFEGMVSDMARSVAIGQVSPEAERLMRVTEESLLRGIAVLKPGTRVSEYAQAVQSHVEAAGFSVVRDLVGHSVGRELHEDLQVPNYVTSDLPDIVLRKGMTLALEPMVNAGKYAVKIGADGWTFVTQDGSLSAHFEDTVIITDDGAEIVTRP